MYQKRGKTASFSNDCFNASKLQFTENTQINSNYKSNVSETNMITVDFIQNRPKTKAIYSFIQ